TCCRGQRRTRVLRGSSRHMPCCRTLATPLPRVAFFFFMIRPPPTSTLFSYTTLFRSNLADNAHCVLTTGGNALNEGLDLVVEGRSEEHTSELQSQSNLVCRLLLEKKKTILASGADHAAYAT